MMAACTSPAQSAGFIGSTTSYVDCQAQTLGSGAWSALSAPGSTLSIVLTGFLTITIALIGFNLLLGARFTVREMTLAFVKIGAVFALATSWPAYRTIVYDLVIDGPGQLVAEMGPRAGIIGSDGTLVQRLDMADRGLVQLAILGPGYGFPKDAAVEPAPFAGFDSFALGGSRILFLFVALAAICTIKIIAGLLLGLGPFFIAFLLFDSTRSLFEGWVRVLAGTAIAAVGMSIVLGLQLGLLEPWLRTVLARRMSGEPMPTVPTELFVIVCLFSTALLASLIAGMRLAYAFRLPQSFRFEAAHPAQVESGAALQSRSELRTVRSDIEHSRAAAIANGLTAIGRLDRDSSSRSLVTTSSIERVSQERKGDSALRHGLPLGRTFNRKPGARVSALAARRDKAS